MKILVVDNEPNILKGIVSMLEKYCEGITSIHTATNIPESIKAIKEIQPEIVFMDVELDDGLGFDIIHQLGEIKFQLIFVTAFDKYAINAFKLSAIDFLLKPVDVDDLKLAFDKAKTAIESKSFLNQFEVLKQSLNKLNKHDQKIVLKDNKSLYFVMVDDIYHCEADGSYTVFHLKDNQTITVSKPIKEYELLLEPFGFIRTHNSHLVNTDKISRLDKADGGLLILDNQLTVPISQRKWEHILSILDKQ